METTPSEYGHMEASQYPSPRSIHTSFPSDNGPYTGSSNGYLSDSGSSAAWGKPSDYHHAHSVEPDHHHSFYPGPPPPPPTGSAFLHDARRQYRVQRPRRAPRRLTTKEEANFVCEVKGCGKMFSRSYNFKAHMETHDEKREYPFPCTVTDCNKKFVRKTDLQRHHQSVHMKERNHKCDYCSRMFARKDTLRRHMEDGCSKRFDIGTLDLRAESYDPHHRSNMAPMHHLIPPPTGGLPPMAMPPLGVLGSSMPQGVVPGMHRPRDEHNQVHAWGR